MLNPGCLQIIPVEIQDSYWIKTAIKIAQFDKAKRMEARKDVDHGWYKQSVLVGYGTTPSGAIHSLDPAPKDRKA